MMFTAIQAQEIPVHFSIRADVHASPRPVLLPSSLLLPAAGALPAGGSGGVQGRRRSIYVRWQRSGGQVRSEW